MATETKKRAEKDEVDASEAAKRQKTSASISIADDNSEDDFVPPADWPPAGEIDLAVHDLPHNSSATEWWYVNGHVKNSKGKEYSFFASFFRICKKVRADGKIEHLHSVIWALVDPDTQEYIYDSVVDPGSPQHILESLEKPGSVDLDPRMRRAFIELCKRDAVPLPDRLAKNAAKVSMDKLALDYDGQTFVKEKNGNYRVKCNSPSNKFAFDLTLKPKKKPIRHGHDGAVKIGLKTDIMFYYFIPRCDVTGSITIRSRTNKVKGDGWYDHEFGGTIADDKYEKPPEKKEVKEKEEQKRITYAWNWLAIQFEDGTDLTATTVIASKTKKVYDQFTIVIDPDSKRSMYLDCDFKPLNSWLSVRTAQNFPTAWKLTVPEAKIDLDIKAAFEDQEFITLLSEPAFWEGRIHVTGTMNGKAVKGIGFIERHGHETLSDMDFFYKKVGAVVREEIAKAIPLEPKYEESRTLIAGEDFDHFMDGVNLDVYRDTVIKPIRDIVDRGGKAWRSFSLLLCIDSVGGYSPKYKHWISMPEIMHVGSLIIDDIQDKSDTRRGGATIHKTYGEDVAINSGTAAYFMTLQYMIDKTPWLSEKTKNRVYELYFLTLRAGHCGQALDINGMDYMMEQVVENGEGALLEQRVRATHRLKSAVPAGNLARMGAMLGDGSEEQIEALGRYFEALGVAFQIIDDVLNLRGFEGKTKTRGEDIMAGKITYPVAKGMTKLSKEERRRVWDIIKTKPQDVKVVEGVCDTLEACGGIQASVDESKEMVENAWLKVDSLIPDSFHKLLLRAFGWYVLERHY